MKKWFVRSAAVAAAAGMVVVGSVVAPAGAAPGLVGTKTYKACADKDTGAIRLIVKGKKCKKSEKKMQWNVQGPAGIAGPVGATGATGATGVQGPPGPAINVRDSNGTVLGQFMLFTPGPGGAWYVLFEGGAYLYANLVAGGGERRQPLGAPVYLTNTCTGTPFFNTGGTVSDVAAGGPERLLQLFTDTSAEAFAFSGAASTTLGAATPAWQKNAAKACVALGAPLTAGTKNMPLTPVTAPPFAMGQIRIG